MRIRHNTLKGKMAGKTTKKREKPKAQRIENIGARIEELLTGIPVFLTLSATHERN